MSQGRQYIPDTVVGPQVALTEQLDTDRPLCIRGTLEGDLVDVSTVLIAEEGLVSANVTAEHIVVQGVVVGSIRARRVEICASGKVWGNVCTQTFYVEPGGFIRGHIITPLQSKHILSARSLESSTDSLVVPPLQKLPDDDLDHLLADLEAAAQRATAVGGPLVFPSPLNIKEALARVAEAKNWTIYQLQLELQAIQSTLTEQEALVTALSADATHAGSERETVLVQQNAELREELECLRLTVLQRQQRLTRLQVELEETYLALTAIQDENIHLSTDLTTASAQLQSLNDELARSRVHYDHLVAATTEASEQLHSQLAGVTAERDQTAADLDAAREQIARLTDQLAQDHAAAEQLAVERSSLQADLERSRDEHVAARQRVEQLAAERDTLQTTVAQLTGDLDAAEQQTAHLTDQLAQAQAAAERLAAERDAVQTERGEIRTTVAQLTADLEAAQRQIAQLAGVTAERDQTAADLDAAREQIARLTDQLAQDHAAAEQLAAERSSLQADLERSRDEYVAAQASVEQLTADHDAARQRVEQLAAERDTLQTTVAQLTGDLDAAEQQTAHLTDQLAQAQAAAERPAAERDAVQTERGEIRTTVAQLTADLEAAQRQIARLAEKEAETARLQADLRTSQDQIEQQQQTHTTYCLVCHARRRIAEACEIVMPDGRRAIRGLCTVCGASLVSLMPPD